MKKQNFKLVIEYDGTEFSGWQIQPGVRTVQRELEKSLSSLFQENIRVIAAGRTDSGVHARGQVIHFFATHQRSQHEIYAGLNSLLPPDISVSSVKQMPADFHARFSAVKRHYVYQIVFGCSALRCRYAWCLRGPLNVHDMQRCAEIIIGEHDFKSFCSSQAEVDHYNCRVIQSKWFYISGDELVFSITANRFLHNMVRILVGTMVEVGRNRFSVTDFTDIFHSKKRQSAGKTAPAQGLFFTKVDY